MNRNITIIKKHSIYAFLVIIISSLCIVACDTAYTYDIEDGIDNNSADGPNISVETDEGIDVSLYEQARIFPGLVDTLKEERVETTIVLDLNKNYTDSITLKVRKVPEPIYSTGLFAGAGEKITIIVEGQTMGLNVIIGPHMDDLTSLNPYLRSPIVSITHALFPGENIIRNPLGGTIWIQKDKNLKAAGNCSLKFKGVYKSADYIRDETDIQEWKKKITETTVPWLEIRGKHFAFTVPKSQIKDNLDDISSNLDEVLELWDEAIKEYHYSYYALKFGNNIKESQRAPEFPIRVVLDVQLLNNLYIRNSDHAIVAINNNYMFKELFDPKTLKTGNSIALFRILNSMFTYRDRLSPWPDYLSEVVFNIPLYRLAQKNFANEKIIGSIFPEEDNIAVLFPKALDYVAADSSKWLGYDKASMSNSWGGETFKAFRLLNLVQLANYNNSNWTLMEALNEKAKEERVIDNSNLNYFYRFLCDHFQRDFAPFFDQWGMDLSEENRVYGVAKNYPLLDKKIWEYNPLSPNTVGDYNGSDYCYRHDRRQWKAKAFDKDYNNNTHTSSAIENTFDMNKSTVWYSALDSEGKSLQLPYYIVFDLNEQTNIDGIYLASGNVADRIADLHVEYIGGNVSNPYDPNLAWTTLIQETNPTVLNSSRNNERFFACPRTQVRYLRLKMANENTMQFDPNSELTEEEKQERKRRHAIAEFGTYYKKP